MMVQKRFIGRISIFVFIMLFVFIACSKEGAHKFITSINEEGVEICVNSGGPKYSEPLYDIEETLSLGGEEEDLKLFQPMDFLIGDDSTIYISDDNRIKIFDYDGEFLQYIGNRGEGPGEVNYPSLYKIFGDSLIVGQGRWRGKRKYELFDLNGKFINRIYLPTVEKKLIPEGGNRVDFLLRNKTFLFYSSHSWEQEEYQLSSFSYGLVDYQGKLIRDLNLELRDYPSVILIRTENTRGGMARPYMLGIKIKHFECLLYALLPEGKEIWVFGQSGNLKQKILLDIKRQPITHEEREKIKAARNQPNDPFQIKDRHFPDYKPHACDFIVDDNRNIWLRKGKDYYNFGKEPTTYIIIDENGEYIADQILPIRLSVVKNNHAYGFIMTEDDLRIFKRYKLIKRK